MRFACDTGGTFTDLIVEADDGSLSMFKSATIATDPVRGVIDVLQKAADAHAESLRHFLDRGEMLIHGTTHAINAIITSNTAKTAFLTTSGNPDILVLREGGRSEPFNQSVPFPESYVPRSLTFEIPERINYQGKILEPLDEAEVLAIIRRLKEERIEAIGICLLWSIVNPEHENRIATLLTKHLPEIPFTLSHQLNPAIREYRRASATCIDASLKPLMTDYMSGLTDRLQAAGFNGKVLIATSQGGMTEGMRIADSPIHCINSGPSMAPVAGWHYASQTGLADNVIVADTGGTTYDVSLVRSGQIPYTYETWIGPPYQGHMTGFPSVDVKSVGAGGGSIAWVDEGGVLHVGPESAGATPGPACYAKGGERPTVTDACLVLGYLDPDYFLGGSLQLNTHLARQSIEKFVALPLNLSIDESAAAIIDLATENMVQAISDITISQGIDPANATLVGGGGAAGLNSAFIARRLACTSVIFPEVGAALSASGALISDLRNEYRSLLFTTTANFDGQAVTATLEQLTRQCQAFIDNTGSDSASHTIEYAVEARYPDQVWEIELPLEEIYFDSDEILSRISKDFHQLHRRIFAIDDPESHIEFVTWIARVNCRLRKNEIGQLDAKQKNQDRRKYRNIYFSATGRIKSQVLPFESLEYEKIVNGPAIIESPFTTIVVDPGSQARASADGNLILTIQQEQVRE